ncbi:MAG: hypothetical protein AAF598_16190 [Bacteroidota bacterium]
MDTSETPQQDPILALPCPSCGSELAYSAEKKMIVCGHCGHQEPVNEAQDRILENNLQEAIHQMPSYEPELQGQKVMECQNCGAETIIDAKKVNLSCGFCGSEKINQDAQRHKYLQPAGIIPFQLPEGEADNKFDKWIKKGWFRPSKLQRLASREALHAVYVPFWTFDAQTESDYSGQAGYHYYETKTVKVGDSFQQKRVQKTRWVHRSGHLSHFFDDVMVVAADGIQPKLMKKILPFNLKKLVNYDPRLAVGWETEVYNVELDQGYKKAEQDIDAQIRNLVKAAIGGDVQRVHSIQTFKYDQTFKHILLPIWVCSYMYQNKIYQFAINGQTGKIKGQKPISWFKVVGLILFITAIILLIVFLQQRL